MGANKYVNLYFDRFVFPASYDVVKKMIIYEMNRLSKETGYSIRNLKIEFKDNYKNQTIAYFFHAGDRPIGFCFYLNMLNNLSPNKIIDVCRHEFAHYVVCMRNAGHQPKDDHGSKWKNVCGELGALQSAHLHNFRTRHLAVNKN